MAALPGNLDGTRVLDLTREPGFFAGKLLADPERSLLWLAMNTSKRGVTLDLARPRGRALFLELAARADAVLETDPTPGLGWPELRAQNPRLVHFALLARERTGEGQHVDVALQEAMVMPNIGTAAMWKMTGNRGARAGAFMRQERSVAREIWPCKDGFVSFALRGGPARIPGLVAMVKYMDEHGMASAALRG